MISLPLRLTQQLSHLPSPSAPRRRFTQTHIITTDSNSRAPTPAKLATNGKYDGFTCFVGTVSLMRTSCGNGAGVDGAVDDDTNQKKQTFNNERNILHSAEPNKKNQHLLNVLPVRMAKKSDAAAAVKLCNLNSYAVPGSSLSMRKCRVCIPSTVAFEYSPAVDAGR